ncbi:PABIR family member 2-like isoform X2 [Petromyzon marinus]|uniref:PABIR family member 2-like isoform X2 n=1 Tax=Petromyzon marinus TaxID=7757 RepID=UPI003F72532D
MAQEGMELEFCGETMPENALRRSNSLPMINNACESFQVTVPGFPRPRRNSVSLSGGHSLEEGMDVMNREATAQDRDVQAAMQVGQPWEDFSPCEQMCDAERPAAPASAVSEQRRSDSFPPPSSCPAAAASSPPPSPPATTRAFGRLFAPSLQQAVVSGGGGAFLQRRPQPARRSNSPGSCVRPGTFGCLKRKVDPGNEMPSKRSFPGPASAAAATAALLSTSPEFPVIPHPLTHSLSWSSLESGGSCSPPQKGPQPEAPKADTFLPPFTPASRPSAM